MIKKGDVERDIHLQKEAELQHKLSEVSLELERLREEQKQEIEKINKSYSTTIANMESMFTTVYLSANCLTWL